LVVSLCPPRLPPPPTRPLNPALCLLPSQLGTLLSPTQTLVTRFPPFPILDAFQIALRFKHIPTPGWIFVRQAFPTKCLHEAKFGTCGLATIPPPQQAELPIQLGKFCFLSKLPPTSFRGLVFFAKPWARVFTPPGPTPTIKTFLSASSLTFSSPQVPV